MGPSAKNHDEHTYDLPDPGNWPGPNALAWQVAAWYHERTKHGVDAFARSRGFMDWANQPDPYRRFEGAPLNRLPLPSRDETPPYSTLHAPDVRLPESLTAQSLSDFLYYSLAISAWKSQREETWALRCNPSSGNLHPTEAYLFLDKQSAVADRPTIFHYRPDAHALEQRTTNLGPGPQDLLPGLPGGSFLVALSSIHWREAWKYGERAFRYCQLDVGHAIAGLRLAAATNDWQLTILPSVPASALSRLTGIDRREDYSHGLDETPELLAVVATAGEKFDEDLPVLDQHVLSAFTECTWHGQANRLSRKTDRWRAIELAQMNCRHPDSAGLDWRAETARRSFDPEIVFPFAKGTFETSSGAIIRRRRSAQMMDGTTHLPRKTFYSMLARTLPGLSVLPWDAQTWPTAFHLGLFVHLVDGIEPGLYCLVRDPQQLTAVQDTLQSAEFLWQTPAGCPSSLPLYQLRTGDLREQARRLSCNQEIAGSGAFSLGMFSRLLPLIKAYGADHYRRLLWEAGMIGQVLYLEAEYHGLRGTGIGCFFDDPVHACFGLPSPEWQSVYHFTVGGPLSDLRVRTLPAYPEKQ